jgi:hypothetical protein
MTRTLIIATGLVLAFASQSLAQQVPPVGPPTTSQAGTGPAFVDADGDGICDRFQAGAVGQRAGQGQGRKLGPQDGSGQKLRLRDGTGRGLGPATGKGVCDGTGPKGRARRGGQ